MICGQQGQHGGDWLSECRWVRKGRAMGDQWDNCNRTIIKSKITKNQKKKGKVFAGKKGLAWNIKIGEKQGCTTNITLPRKAII